MVNATDPFSSITGYRILANLPHSHSLLLMPITSYGGGEAYYRQCTTSVDPATFSLVRLWPRNVARLLIDPQINNKVSGLERNMKVREKWRV